MSVENFFETVDEKTAESLDALFTEDGNIVEPMKVDNKEVDEVDISEENLINKTEEITSTVEVKENTVTNDQQVTENKIPEQPKKRRGRPVGSKTTKIKIVNPESSVNNNIEVANKVEQNNNNIMENSTRVTDEEVCWNYIYNNYSEKNDDDIINELKKSFNQTLSVKDIEKFVDNLKNELNLRVQNNNLTHSEYAKIVNNKLTKKNKFSNWVASLTF